MSGRSAKDRLFAGRWQLAVGVARRGILHLLRVVADLEVPRTHGCPVKRHHEPVPGRHPGLDRAERRQAGAGVNVDGLQPTDLVTLGVNHVVAAPFPDVAASNMPAFLPQRHAAVLPMMLPRWEPYRVPRDP